MEISNNDAIIMNRQRINDNITGPGVIGVPGAESALERVSSPSLSNDRSRDHVWHDNSETGDLDLE